MVNSSARGPDARAARRGVRLVKKAITQQALDVPRDWAGTFEPRPIGNHERRFTGVDDTVLALYARGLTVREIQAFLRETYGVDVSPDLIST